MKRKSLLMLALVSQLIFSCKKEINDDETIVSKDMEETALLERCKPQLKIAVVSDIHYMDPSLFKNNGAAGTAFQDYINGDPKILQYSASIFQNVMAQIKWEHPDILLVPGDITKDGEKVGAQAMSGFFHKLRKEGIKVYVIPGNHDINNAKAKVYDGNNSYPAAMTSKTDFETIYADFGYNNAISRDPNSLSYVAQPQSDLRIIAIDASKYEEYGPSGDIAAGRIKPATLAWILDQLSQAKKHNITVFAMMHQNLVEHYAGQTQIDPGYVIDDYQNVANTLMDAGLKIIFTGHYHANDITSYTHNGKELFDIETGSLVTPPAPFRLITMKNNALDITTKTVQTIAATLPGGVQFPVYENTFLTQHLDGYFNYYLTNQFGAPADLAAFAAPLFRNGIMAHFAGDENMPPDQRSQIEYLATISQQLAGIAITLWTDLGIKDNKTVIKYK